MKFLNLDEHKSRILKKVEELNKSYDYWFFVVAEAPDAYKYAKFGLTYTRKNVCRKLRSYFKKSVSGEKRLETRKVPKTPTELGVSNFR